MSSSRTDLHAPEPYAPPAAAPPRAVVAAPPRRRARAAARAARAARAAGLVAVFAGAMEATARVEDWMRYDTPLLSPYRSQGDLMVRDRDGIHGRPNAVFQKWRMNALGMRGPAAAREKPAGTVRVITVGASETFGLYESPGREYPRQLEAALNDAARSAGSCTPPRFEVLNAALPGMSLPTVEQDVRNRLRGLRPDVVLAYPTPVQYLDEQPPTPARPDSAATGAPPTLAATLHPRIVDRFRNQVKELLPLPIATWLRRRETLAYVRAHPAGWRFTTLPADRLAAYEAELRGLVGAVRAIGATPVLATHASVFARPGGGDAHLLAMWAKFYPRATGPVIVAFDSAARVATLRVAADSGVAVVDLARILARDGDRTFRDFAHFTDAGAARVATALRPAVARAGARRLACDGADRLAGRQ